MFYCKIKTCSLIHPLGMTPDVVFNAVKKEETALAPIKKTYLDKQTYAALFSAAQNSSIRNQCPASWSRFEQLLFTSVNDIVKTTTIQQHLDDVLFVISTTKGSIDEIADTADIQNLVIADSVNKVLTELNIKNQPVIISNACISGLSAIIIAANYLKAGKYKYAVVIGTDVIDDFILSGFNSLLALSDQQCKPFDENRNGINLGEGSAAIVLERTEQLTANDIFFGGGAITNDANHISGPSRTGEELAFAINKAMHQAGLNTVDFVSAHGTATLYNDEMESKAFKLTQLQDKPVHSLKPYLGHTLGAAGIIESILCVKMLEQNILIPSLGYVRQGTSVPLNIQTTLEHKTLNNCIKTMSGFGGCNAAVCFVKS